ncbi:hypothetical protein MMC07_009816 [Pseudocyphellaria aurata]|nr:hypothetical protein [Pseudocyphellaria aurata]
MPPQYVADRSPYWIVTDRSRPRQLSPETHHCYLRKFAARLYRKNQPLSIENLVPFLKIYPHSSNASMSSTRLPRELTPKTWQREHQQFTERLLRTNQRLSDANYALFHATFVRVVRALPDTAESPTRVSSLLALDNPDRVDTPLNTLMTGGIALRASSGKSAAAVRHGRKDKQGRKKKRD